MLEDATGETLDGLSQGETPTQREIEQAQRIVEQYGTGTASDYYDGDGD